MNDLAAQVGNLWGVSCLHILLILNFLQVFLSSKLIRDLVIDKSVEKFLIESDLYFFEVAAIGVIFVIILADFIAVEVSTVIDPKNLVAMYGTHISIQHNIIVLMEGKTITDIQNEILGSRKPIGFALPLFFFGILLHCRRLSGIVTWVSRKQTSVVTTTWQV